MVDTDSLNPLSDFNIGLGTIGNILLLFFIAILVVIGIGVWIFLRIDKKKYRHIIPLYKRIGNVPTRIATLRAKDIPIGKAGDKLWYVRGVKKHIPPATLQSAPNEYMHWEREDGEWINFTMGDLDKDQKEAGVKYIHQDMRSQRIATNNILEQRLIHKNFWEQYKDMIVQIVFYFITVLCMVIIFWQWSGIVEQISGLVDKLDTVLLRFETLKNPQSSIIPALAFFSFRKWGKR